MAIFRNELEKKKKVDTKDVNDLMDGLLQLEDKECKKLCDIELLDNIIGFVLGGYESTSLSIMWALHYLAKYSIVLKKLRKLKEENMPFSKRKNKELVTRDDLARLKLYTSKVVEETLRSSSITTFLFRTATKDAKYKGYKIPEGWKVLLWVKYLHKNPENFEDPINHQILDHSKYLVGDQKSVLETCLLDCNFPSFFITWPLDASKTSAMSLSSFIVFRYNIIEGFLV
ncbi:hypothetical protein RJ640_015179 [Escallonia rubra]|uniref:Cytochrome P450 n=1 Tax=Escallonia rubra TaxID=112253 RepID=A0AA88UPR3_9ASTE|nr:hypothetical protein RJ640_015179 [Escallonia rubra]